MVITLIRDEILAKWDSMTPRERDAWVAQDVMGLKIEEVIEPDYFKHSLAKLAKISKRERNKIPPVKKLIADGKIIKFYSTDITAAWEALEKIINTFNLSDYKQEIQVFYTQADRKWFCWVTNKEKGIYGEGKTAQEAICKAALLFKEALK